MRQIDHVRVAGAEIVERNLHPDVLYVPEHVAGFLRVVHQCAFRYLQTQHFRRQIEFAQGFFDHTVEGAGAELSGRDVEGDVDRVQAHVQPGPDLLTDGTQDPLTNRGDQA